MQRWTSVIHKLLSVDLKWGHFLFFKEKSLNFWQQYKTSVRLDMSFPVSKFDLPCHRSYTDSMNSSFKVDFMLSVLTLGFIFLEETEPCHFEIPKFSFAIPWIFKIRATDDFNLPLAGYVLASLGDFPCWTITFFFLARVGARTICKHPYWFIHFVLNK